MMRNLFLLSCLLLLSFSLTAQLEIFGDLDLASNLCTGSNPIPADCDFAQDGINTLTYLPGEDEDILITYRVANNSGKRIVRAVIMDSYFGSVLPPTVVNVLNGDTIRSNRIYGALTTPQTINGTITLSVEYANTTTETVTGSYTIEVVAPEAYVEVFLVAAEDFCTDTTDLATCPVAPNTTPNTITVAPGEIIYREFRLQVTGQATVYDHEWLDDTYGLQAAPATATPGGDLRFRELIQAPTTPGTYPVTVMYTGVDAAGNEVNRTTNYTITVAAPEANVEVFLLAADGFCTDTTDLASCPVAPNTSPNTITVAPGEIIYREFRLQVTGVANLNTHEWLDDYYGLQADPATARPGSDLRFRELIQAPTTPGTYPITGTYTGEDNYGNTVTRPISYTITVAAPEANVEVFLLAADGFCTDTTDLASCPVAPNTSPNTITVAPGEIIYREFRLQVTGVANLNTHEWLDNYYGLQADPATARPGSDLRFRELIQAPTTAGTYSISGTYTGEDNYGNTVTRPISYTITVDCALGDQAPPNAICQDLMFTIDEDETQTIIPGQVNNGSSDDCSGLDGGSLDISSFTCSNEGPNLVTLTVSDNAGNEATCTATVTIDVREDIYPGENNFCLTTVVPVMPGQAWQDIRTPGGRLIAQVIIGNNTNIAGVRANVFRTASLTETVSGEPYLSKRANLRMLDSNGDVVLPNTDPVYVRIYYTEVEIAALLAAAPGSDISTLTVVKTDGVDCGSGYNGDGTNPLAMTTTTGNVGCNGENLYLEFFTGAFSTFYLFPSNSILPVELLDFTATAAPQRQIRLQWATATETNNRHFLVERSSDGRRFTTIGQVNGAGDSRSRIDYNFIDDSPVAGSNFYRLRQIDFDGAEMLSEVREVRMESEVQISVYPNPVANDLQIAGFTGGLVTILDVQGKVLIQRVLTANETLNVANLVAGVYLLRLGNETLRWIKK